MLILPKILAHRGASAYAPENTIVAMRRAKELGATWVEFDVMLTQCGEPIIFHDETLERTTNGKGEVKQFTFAELQKLDAGSWFNAEFSNVRVPSLRQMIDCLIENKLHANFEIKPSSELEDITVRKTLELLDTHWPNELHAVISSFSYGVLQAVRNYSSTIPLAYLTPELTIDDIVRAQHLNCISINHHQQNLSASKINAIKGAGFSVLAYTVDDNARAQELFALGVDGVFSNNPDKIKAF